MKESPALAAPVEGLGDDWLRPGRFALLLGLFILVMFPDVILGGRTFIFRDFGAFGYPLAFHHRESFWRGEIPLWNPLSHCGIPFLAQWNTLVLYPGSLFYLLLPLDWSLGVFNLLHLFLCGLGMYALAGAWTGNRLAATIAGLAYAFNGFTLNCLMWPNYIASLAWMPLVVLTVERAWRLGGRTLVWAALAGAMQMLSGTPEIILLTWLLLAALWLVQLWQSAAGAPGRASVPASPNSAVGLSSQGSRGRSPSPWQVALRLLAVVLLVAGLSAAQLLPFLDLMRCSQRSPGIAPDEWPMPLTGWANFLVPLFRTVQSSAGVYFQDQQRITSSYYLGISVVLLALVAAWQVKDRRVVLFSAITGVCLVLALGHSGVVYSALLKLFPPLAFMRFPIKFVILPEFLVPLLAAFAVAAYLRAPPAAMKGFWRSGLVLGLLFVLAIALVVGFARYRPAPDEVWSTTAMSGLTRACFLVVILSLWLAIGRVAAPRVRLAVVLGLVAMVWLDDATHVPRQNPTVEREVFQPGLLPLMQLQPKPAIGKSRAMLSLEALLAHRTKILTNAAAGYLVQRLAMYNNANLIDDLPKVDGFFALRLREEEEARSVFYPNITTYNPVLADFLSVSQVTSATNLFEWTSRPTFLPMATAGQKPIFLERTNTLAALASTQFDPRAVAFLSPQDRARVSVTNQTTTRVLPGNWSAQRITFTVEAAEPALVVVAQSFYHNWRAYVGGKSVPLLRANYAYQALEVPSGRQEVALIYEDRAFYLGAVISLISVATLVGIWVHAPKLGRASVLASPGSHRPFGMLGLARTLAPRPLS